MRVRGSWVWVVAVAVVALGFARPAVAQDGQRYIVIFRAGTAAPARLSAVGSAGAAMRVNFAGVAAAAVTVPNTAALAALRGHPSVADIVPDRPVFAFQAANAKGGKPGGGGGATQTVPVGVTRVGVPTVASNGAGVGIAILDTGVDLAHTDLSGTVDAFSAFGGSCQDDAGHGTHVAGTVAARDNASGVVGVAPLAGLYCVKVLDGQGNGSDTTLMDGLDWVLQFHAAVQPAIRVVNMSLGRPGDVNDNPALHDLIVALEAAGVAVVVSAGNDAAADVSQMIPAAYGEVISVASTTAAAGTNQCRNLSAPIAADTASYFTTDGQGVTISAPGEDQENVSRGCMIQSVGILSTRLGGGTTRMSGTSMSAPHVSGIVVRYLQTNPSLTVAGVRQVLVDDAVRTGTAPLNSPTSSYSFDGVREGIAQAP